MASKNKGRQTAQKNKFRFDPKANQPKPVASTSGGALTSTLLSPDEDIINDTFQPKKVTPPPNVLDTDEFVPIDDDENMDTDNLNFTVIPHLTPFACTTTIKKSARELPTAAILKTINGLFAHDDAFKGANVRRVNFIRLLIIYFDNEVL